MQAGTGGEEDGKECRAREPDSELEWGDADELEELRPIELLRDDEHE
jgi:hypothetical protein